MSTPTDRQLAGNQRRTLRSMRERLLKMAAEWDGLDQFNMNRLTELADQVDEVVTEVLVDVPGDR